MVKVDDLRDVNQFRKEWLVRGMVKPGTAMQQQHGGDFFHPGTIGAQFRAFDVKEQFTVADLNSHGGAEG